MNRSRVANTFVQVEKALAVAPDSAMRLLKDIPAKSLGNQAMRARYALLYIDAAERAQLNENTDSLLRIAWRYYRKHPQEMQNRCRTLYYMAHSKLRQGDKPGALRLFLEVEKNNDSLDNPRDRGMLYLSIGDVYRGELNFVRAYRYYREARELFLRSGDMRHRIEALLGMTACGLRMHDFEQTRRNCRLALELSDEAHYEQLAQKSLGYLAALYALSDKGSLPEEDVTENRAIRSPGYDRHGFSYTVPNTAAPQPSRQRPSLHRTRRKNCEQRGPSDVALYGL